MTDPELLVEVVAGVGRIRLNRPRQINALTVPMMRALSRVLDDFAADDAVTSVELTGAGERGLCAGADVRALRERALSGGDVREFFETEYGVDLQVAGFPKPYRAVMTGITMGAESAVYPWTAAWLLISQVNVPSPLSFAFMYAAGIKIPSVS